MVTTSCYIREVRVRGGRRAVRVILSISLVEAAQSEQFAPYFFIIRQNSPSVHHRTNLSDYIVAIKACINNWKKLLNSGDNIVRQIWRIFASCIFSEPRAAHFKSAF